MENNDAISLLTDVSYFPRFENVPKGIRSLREHLQLSQRKLAKILGVSCMTVSFWERGIYRPRPQIERKLAIALDKLEGINS